MGSFVPLVFSTFGGMSGCTNVVYKRLVPCSSVTAWLCYHLSFSLLRSAIACLRGVRSHSSCLASHRALDLSLIEGRVPFS